MKLFCVYCEKEMASPTQVCCDKVGHTKFVANVDVRMRTEGGKQVFVLSLNWSDLHADVIIASSTQEVKENLDYYL